MQARRLNTKEEEQVRHTENSCQEILLEVQFPPRPVVKRWCYTPDQ